jgi:hypothetical protein
MVQFLVIDEDDEHRYRKGHAKSAIKDKNSYWKLGLDEDQSARKMIKYLEDHGYRCRGNATKTVALDAVGRYQRGLMSYEGLSVSELQSLCKAKGLSSKAKTASRLARALEKADDNAMFRFLDLPAEIRNMIYELYFLELPNLSGSHIQPPLTLASRLLRTEALPLFYGCATFVFTILSDTDVENGGLNTTGFSCGAHKMMQIPVANFSQIKNFRLEWQEVEDFWDRRRRFKYLAVDVTHRNTVGKAISVTGWVLKHRGKHLNESLSALICDFGYWEDDFGLQSKHIKALAAAVPLIRYLR